MKYLFFVFIIFFPLLIKSQNNFFKLEYFEFPSVFFTCVYPTDSCYFIGGRVVDTIMPLRTGVMFSKFDLNGKLQCYNILKHPDRLFSNYFSDLVSTQDGNFLNTGNVGDTITHAIVYQFSSKVDTILTKEYLSIVYPNLNYLVTRQVRINQNNSTGILIGHESIFNQDFNLSLLILDTLFNIKHYKSYGTAKQETATALITDDDGGFIIGADRNNLNQVTQGFTNQTYIIKTDSTGELKWQYLSNFNTLQGPAQALIKTADGGLVVGSTRGYEDPVHPTIHVINWETLIFKLDSNRNVVWSTPFRGAQPATITNLIEMVAAADGSGYVAAGKVADGVSGLEVLAGSWLVKVSPTGDSLWARYYTIFDGEDINPEPYDLKQTADGGYIVVGYSRVAGPKTPGWILKVDEYGCLVPGCHIVDVQEQEAESIQIKLYPNPASDFLNVWYRPKQPGKKAVFKVADTEGRILKTIEAPGWEMTMVIAVRDYAPGVYFLQCFHEDQLVKVEKLIRQ
jgi:hypothetical protein